MKLKPDSLRFVLHPSSFRLPARLQQVVLTVRLVRRRIRLSTKPYETARALRRNRRRHSGVLFDENGVQSRSYLWETDVDTPPRAPIECFLEQGASARHREESAVTLIKIIIITLAVILSILFLGRFLF